MKPLKLITLTVALTAAVDQASKALIVRAMDLYDAIEVIPGLFNLVYWKNAGFAFGLFRDWEAGRTLVAALVTLVAVVLLTVLLRSAADSITRFSLSLVAGGALGNFIDRVARGGEVVDFLDFHLGTYHWPAFNIADSAITVGVFLTLFLFYFRGNPGGSETKGG